MRRVKKSLIKFCVLSLLFSPLFGASDYSYASNSKTIYEHGEANYFEKWLGMMEVGSTSLDTLKLYIGEGETIKNPFGETVYYIDNKNQKTLIVEVNNNGVIEIVTYKNKIELPPGIKKFEELKMAKKMNIKNLMTSMGSRMGYSYTRIVGAYGRPSKEIVSKSTKELKYIKTGEPSSNVVYLEYSFKLVNNKTVEIRIENGR